MCGGQPKDETNDRQDTTSNFVHPSIGLAGWSVVAVTAAEPLHHAGDVRIAAPAPATERARRHLGVDFLEHLCQLLVVEPDSVVGAAVELRPRLGQLVADEHANLE